ncbi:MAG: D-alanyl-D-alanine carboxypeptidase/D-alanyl-D-alanine-endopeptidase [Pyrinomonadaceae bacterium]
MIRKTRTFNPLSLLLIFTLTFAAMSRGIAQDAQQRERRVTPVTPTVVQTPAPTPTPVAASAAPTTLAPKTLGELQARIDELSRSAELAPALVAVKVVSLDTGRTLYEENAGKLLRPASNMKLYTVAAALDRLSPDYRFKTSVQAVTRPDAKGTLRGDLIIYGRGDPTYATRFNDGSYTKAIDELAASIAAAGVKRVEGDLVGNDTYFAGPPLGSGWEWEDLQWWYGAEVSALTINDNSVDLNIKPGSKLNMPCTITMGPPVPFVSILNHTTTTERGTMRNLFVYRSMGGNVIEVGGSLPLDDRGYMGSAAIPHPALAFIYLLRASLAQRGVIITGRSRTIDPPASRGNPSYDSPLWDTVASRVPLIEIASRQSPPLSLIAAQTLKPSQNLYTELLLRTLGKSVPPDSTKAQTHEEAGIEVVKTFLREAGLAPDALVITDGSGLSRNDMVRADATLQLLTYMSRHRYADVFRDALPVAGVDGTLRNRMKGTPAQNNLRAKTGTLSSATSLSGYVTSAAGEHLAFSIMVNNYPSSANVNSNFIDQVAVLLASFAGRS